MQPGPLSAPTGDRESRPWLLIRRWDGGSRLAVQYSSGCDEDVDIGFEENEAHVLVQVVDEADEQECDGRRGIATSRAILALSAPLRTRVARRAVVPRRP
jgi:hypothetical protein